jgi:hypothetical protein
MLPETEIALRNYEWFVNNRPGDYSLDWDTGTFQWGDGGTTIDELGRPGFTPATRD